MILGHFKKNEKKTTFLQLFFHTFEQVLAPSRGQISLLILQNESLIGNLHRCRSESNQLLTEQSFLLAKV